MIRAFIRWLAKREIEQACAVERVLCDFKHASMSQIEYSKAYIAGVEHAIDVMEKALRKCAGDSVLEVGNELDKKALH